MFRAGSDSGLERWMLRSFSSMRKPKTEHFLEASSNLPCCLLVHHGRENPSPLPAAFCKLLRYNGAPDAQEEADTDSCQQESAAQEVSKDGCNVAELSSTSHGLCSIFVCMCVCVCVCVCVDFLKWFVQAFSPAFSARTGRQGKGSQDHALWQTGARVWPLACGMICLQVLHRSEQPGNLQCCIFRVVSNFGALLVSI